MRRGSKIIAALAALTILASPLSAAPVVIDDDRGGDVDAFRMWYKRLADSGVPVVLRGVCISACTFIATLPKGQVCVEPTASLGFHLWSTGGKPDQGYTEAGFRRLYSQAILDWIAAQPPLRVWPITFMSAEDMVALGIFPACAVSKAEE